MIAHRGSVGCSSHLFITHIISRGIACGAHTTQAVGNDRLAGVAVAAEHIEIVHHILITEVEHQCRVECHTTEAGLEMKM